MFLCYAYRGNDSNKQSVFLQHDILNIDAEAGYIFSVKNERKFTFLPKQIGCKELVKTNFMEIVDPSKKCLKDLVCMCLRREAVIAEVA